MAKQPRRIWTPGEILDTLRAYAEREGRTPRHEDLGTGGLPWAKSIERRFGTLNGALEVAGLPTRPVGRPGSREAAVESLRQGFSLPYVQAAVEAAVEEAA